MFCKTLRTKLRIKRWRKKLNINQHQAIFKEIFDVVDGFTLSRTARSSADAMEYVYGEIEFEPFIAMLSLTKPDSNTIFYDLGSGTGNAAIACAMVFDVQKSIGIEKFNTLHACAIQQKNKLAQLKDYQHKANKLHFIQNDFLTANLDEATLIFINATALFGETWLKINQSLSRLKNKPTIITTSKPLSVTNYQLIHNTKAEMSWGVVDVYYYREELEELEA